MALYASACGSASVTGATLNEMTDQRKQKSTPKGKDKSGKAYEGIEIPVPKRKDFEVLLKRAARRDTGND